MGLCLVADNRTDVRCFDGQENNAGRFALFHRHGGVSTDLFASLNIGLGVGDDAAAVAHNRQKVKDVMGVSHLLFGRQVHGEEVYLLDEPLNQDATVDGYDALITRQQGVGLVIQHADCQAVLLYDPVNEAIGAVHSGWRGSVVDLIGKTVRSMQEAFATSPADLHAVISPSLGPCCAEFVNYRLELPQSFWRFKDEKEYFDFWAISREQLLEAGVSAATITLPAVCTSCSPDYFSYRRACRESGGVTGRNGSVVALVNT